MEPVTQALLGAATGELVAGRQIGRQALLFGALIVGVFSLGLRLVGTDPQWTYLLIGVLIIGAGAIDQWIRKVAA